MEHRDEPITSGDSEPLLPGAAVMVRNSLDTWAQGFQVLERAYAGYRVRRVSDGAVLPRAFPRRDLRTI